LTYIIGDGALRTDPKKVETIMKIEVPKYTRQLRSFGKYFWIHASHVGIGAALYQQDVEGSDRALFSAKLRGAQLNYSVREKECHAAVKAVERFRPYVELMPFL